MQELFQRLFNELQQGHPAELVTIIDAGGSTPRGVGALMAVFSDGSSMGSIGGGNVEFASQKLASELLTIQANEIRHFQFSQEDSASLGMVCGGDVTVQFRYVPSTDLDTLRLLQALLDDITAETQNTWLLLDKQAQLPLHVVHSPGSDFDFSRDLLQSRPAVIGQWLSIPLVQSSHVYVFGGGHVAQALIPVIASVGFHPVVYDDREEFSNPRLFPQASATICDNFSNLAQHISLTAEDYVVIMTRGHLSDYTVLSQVLRSGAKYIGCIGSRKKLALCHEKLLVSGFLEDDWKKVYAPIGLNISAETPAEIAISIVAELICVRAGRDPRKPGSTDSLSGS